MDNVPIIKTDADLQAVLQEIERLWEAPADTPEGDRLDLLSTLAHAYEAKHIPMPELDAIEFLKAHMLNAGLTQGDLAAVIRSKPRASEVLNRKRPLTLEMIRAINAAWHIPADLLVRQYELA